MFLCVFRVAFVFIISCQAGGGGGRLALDIINNGFNSVSKSIRDILIHSQMQYSYEKYLTFQFKEFNISGSIVSTGLKSILVMAFCAFFNGY